MNQGRDVLDEMNKANEAKAALRRIPFERMLNQHLIVEIHAFKHTGRIIIPDKAQRSPTKGTVICVADDITDIKVGDHILYSQFAGYLLNFEGLTPMRVMGYNEVLAILHKDAPDIVGGEGA